MKRDRRPQTPAAIQAAANSFALCFAVDAADADSEWRELIPAANAEGKIQGVDGRWWQMSAEIARNIAAGFHRPLAVDINHSSELLAPNGGDSPAQGWIEELAERGGALFGRINWTETGANAIKARLYRFLSPVLLYDKASRVVVGLKSAALCNQPNFNLALNSEEPEVIPTVEPEIIEALGLNAEADTADAVTAINSLKAARGTPSLDTFVPRADYNVALNRADAAEQKLADAAKATHDGEIETAINAALEAGKIAPPSVEYHRAQCAMEGGLARFNEYVKTALELGAASVLEGKHPEKKTALNAIETKVAQLFGNSAEDIAKYGSIEEAA